MSTKGRTKFTLSGVHPLLGFVRNHFISKGFALVSWEDEFDFALIGADIGDEPHPPLAQLEFQKMQVVDKPVFLLSSPKVLRPNSGAGVYALAAECLFGLGECLAVRPYNVYGLDVNEGLIHSSLLAARRGERLKVPSTPIDTSFLYQDDFIKLIDKLLLKEARGVFHLGSAYQVSYGHTLHNIWQFVHGPDKPFPGYENIDSFAPPRPTLSSLAALEAVTGWLPKTSVRSGLVKML